MKPQAATRLLSTAAETASSALAELQATLLGPTSDHQPQRRCRVGPPALVITNVSVRGRSGQACTGRGLRSCHIVRWRKARAAGR